MAKQQSIIDSAAETVGSTLGKIVVTVDTIKADHPHPIEEIREVVASGEAQVAKAGRALKTRAQAVAKKAKTTKKAVVKKATSVVRRAKGRTKKVVARAKRTARSATTFARAVKKTAKKAGARGRKAMLRRR